MIDGLARVELLEASDDTIEDALEHADPMVLRGLLYQLTGDAEIASMELVPAGVGFYEFPLPAREEDITLLREKAAHFLKMYRDSGAGELSIGPEERLRMSLEFASGEEITEDETQLYVEELGLDPWARSLVWKQEPPTDRLAQFSVVVIGTGMGGLNAALQLKRAGIPFTVFEKNSGVGGTWHENRYPGIRVDSPSRSYTHIFGTGFGYGYSFCPGAENKRYFEWVANNFGLRDHIVFKTEVQTLRWDEESGLWDICIDGPNGSQVVRANAVITGVGFLNRARLPEIEGMAEFQGPSWHTSRWPQDSDITGNRFAVIGTGSTGYQLIPDLALEAKHVTVFQRTPQWLVPADGYRSPLPPQVTWLDRNFPFYSNFARFRAWLSIWSFARVSEIDPDFDDPDAVNQRNKNARDTAITFLERKLRDPELIAKMTPRHPMMSARPVLVDPEYSVLDAIKRDNVTLITDGIRRITTTGIEANDGTHHEVDVIVYATGFHATEYLFPMTVIGRDGITINELWKDGGARAYAGCMIPGFPNLWMIAGPNTNSGLPNAANGELVTLYALTCMERLILDGKRTVEVREDAYWRYNNLVDERNLRKAWSDPRAHNYYWTDIGRSAVMNPFSPTESWRNLRQPNYDDLEVG